MAGAGYKLFNTGDVLTAAQVNTYLQEQVVMVFANSTARTTALSGVLAEGMVSYLKDTDALEIYSGSAWVGYGSGDITNVSVSSPITGGGASGSVTIGIDDATTSQKGAVQLTDSTSSTSTTTAATPNSVKSAYDLANGAIQKTLTTTTGDIIYASSANTPARLGIGSTGQVLTVSGGIPSWATASSSASYVGCSAYNTGAQTINNNTWTTLAYNAELFDTNTFHDNTTNNTRFTIPSGKAGKYLVAGCLQFDYDSTKTGQRDSMIRKNGTDYARGTTALPTGDSVPVYFDAIVDCAVGDYIELAVYQNRGSSLTTSSGQVNTLMNITFLGA